MTLLYWQIGRRIHAEVLQGQRAGWNLAGNGSQTTIDVATVFGNSTQFTTIWKWVASQGVWAFYAPSLQGQALTDYAANKGYQVLSQIGAGEGFWVNAKVQARVTLPAGSQILLADRTDLPKGWNPLGIGETVTPKAYCDRQSQGVVTLWAWSPGANGAWFFQAPSLEANGTLATYIQNKGYLDFTANSKTLGPGTGFWVNKAN